MSLLSSLRNRVFLATTGVAALSIGFALQFVTSRVSRQAEEELERGLLESAALVEQQHAARVEMLTLTTRLVADLPKLKAALSTGDAPTVEPLAAEYRALLRADLLVLADPDGRPVAHAEASALTAALQDLTALPPPGPAARFVEAGGRVLQVVTVPIALGLDRPEVLGALTAGFAMDASLAARYRAGSASEVAFLAGDRVLASTVPVAPVTLPAPGARGLVVVTAGGEEYLALRRPLAPSAGAPEVLVLRTRAERLQFLRTFRAGLAAAALVALLLAVLLSYAVARTVTRPLTALTDSMRHITATGDLSLRAAASGGWDDDDARLLTRTFDSLAEALVGFQREAGLRERLAALGRMSTVIAHEVRNPLMIIKISVRALRRPEATAADLQEAASDIEGEVERLNRVVDDVLDFARPIRVDAGPVDVSALCRDAAAASSLGGDGIEVQVDLPDDLPGIVSDGERLRTVLVNLLRNAKEALRDAGAAPRSGALLTLRARPRAGGGVVLEVEDRGPGIPREHIAHVFEPYFTTRRTGTGLGLALARNIVEALGGGIALRAPTEGGTCVVIEMPAAFAAPRAS